MAVLLDHVRLLPERVAPEEVVTLTGPWKSRLGHVLAVRRPAHNNIVTVPATETTTEPTTGQSTGPVTEPKAAKTAAPSARTAVLVLAIHALLSVGWAVFAGIPDTSWYDFPFGIIMFVNYFFINSLITVSTGVAYGLQAYSTAQVPPGRSALSRTALIRQIILFFTLAVLWPIRFPAPVRTRYDDPWLLMIWYPLVGWACVNNALIAAGQCIVLYNLGGTDGSDTQSTDQETQPLLAA